MPHKLPKHVRRVRTKGRDYFYFDTGKKVDGKRVYAKLPNIRAPDFGNVYGTLMGHRSRSKPVERLTVPKLVDLFERSAAFNALSPASSKLYTIYLRRLEKLMPTAPVSEITRVHMQRLFDGMGETPSAANAFLKVASALFAWAKARGYALINPCNEIERNAGGEHEPWPDNVLEAALAANDPAVRILAHLLYYTGQRLGDVLRMAWSDISEGRIRVRQGKTKKLLTIKLHESLAKELAGRPRDAIQICTMKSGRVIGDRTARNCLQAFAAQHGAKVVPHGLRKNAVIKLLSVGCSVAETAAISGQSLQMVEHYARARNQTALADSAVLRWERN